MLKILFMVRYCLIWRFTWLYLANATGFNNNNNNINNGLMWSPSTEVFAPWEIGGGVLYFPTLIRSRAKQLKHMQS